MIMSKIVNENIYNETNLASTPSEYTNKILDDYLSIKPESVLKNTEEKREIRASNNVIRDPLTMIDIMLTGYINSRMKKADAIATEIAEKSKAVAEINKLWGKVMSINIKNVDPTDPNNLVNIWDESKNEIEEIDNIIRNILGEPKGISVILPSTENGVTYINYSYDQLQSVNATMTAFSDTVQVDLDSSQQEFKNLMTAITSAQEEIRDLRRIVISFTER